MQKRNLWLAGAGLALMPVLGLSSPTSGVAPSLAPHPAPTASTSDDSEDVYVAHLEELHASLFGYSQPFKGIQYQLPTTLNGPGLSFGVNQHGMPFSLDVTEFQASDMNAVLEADPAAHAVLQAYQVQSGRVLGVLSTGLESIEVGGHVLSYVDPVGGFDSYFLPSGDPGLTDLTFVEEVLDPGWSALAGSTGDFGGRGALDSGGGYVELFCVGASFPAIAGTPECQACLDTHQGKLDTIAENLETELRDLWKKYKETRELHSVVYVAAMAVIETNWLIDIAASFIFSPPPFNFVAAGASYAKKMVAQGAATALYVYKRKKAQEKYDKDVKEKRDKAKKLTEKANQELENCLNEKDCHVDCTALFCIWLEWWDHPETGPQLVEVGSFFNIHCE